MNRYEITGIDREGKRFQICTNSYIHAMSINIWKGTVWIRDLKTNKRRILKKVFN